MAAAAASAACCSSDPGFPLWPVVERVTAHRQTEQEEEDGIWAGIDEQALTSSASASMAAAVCNIGRRQEAERDCSTRASSECGEEVARKERWADLSDTEEPFSPVEQFSNSLSSSTAFSSAAAAATVYEEDGDSRSMVDPTPRRGRGRNAKADHTKGWSFSNTWSGSSAGAAGSWEQWEAPGVQQNWGYGGESRRSGNGKARSWDRTDPASSYAASSTTTTGSWHGSGSDVASSSYASWDSKASGHHDDWWQSQGWSATRGTGASSRGNGRRGKWQCQFFLGIEEEEKFQVVSKVLGSHGKHVKAIAEKSKAKLRLRGRGSGFKEGLEKKESMDDLMLCVSAPDQYGYTTAVSMLWAHLEDIYKQYAEFFKTETYIEVRWHEGPREGSF